jgi:hypothetical protein
MLHLLHPFLRIKSIFKAGGALQMHNQIYLLNAPDIVVFAACNYIRPEA